MGTRLGVAMGILLAGALAGCKSSVCQEPYGVPPTTPLTRGPAPGELVLDRGDWVVGDQAAVFKVLVASRQAGPPDHVGYAVLRRYRQVQGGPVYSMYEVTRLDRNEQVGIVDSLGNAKRFVQRRDGGVDTVDLGSSTIEEGVGAIFGTPLPVTLERTTERRIAFEMLDADKDGFLSAAEWPRSQGAPADADANRDGRVDWQEFDRLDRL